MNRTLVTSSNVASVGYDPELKVLEIEFKNQSVYQYADVPPEKYDGMLHAESVGKFLNSEIKGTYEYTKIKDAVVTLK
jgi:hypothetical protein